MTFNRPIFELLAKLDPFVPSGLKNRFSYN